MSCSLRHASDGFQHQCNTVHSVWPSSLFTTATTCNRLTGFREAACQEGDHRIKCPNETGLLRVLIGALHLIVSLGHRGTKVIFSGSSPRNPCGGLLTIILVPALISWIASVWHGEISDQIPSSAESRVPPCRRSKGLLT